MEHNENALLHGTIYLDIDGVIFPLPDKNSDDTSKELGIQIDQYEFYHPEIVRRLGSLAARIILSSSRGVGTLVDGAYKDLLNELNVQGVLSIDPWHPGSPDRKLDAITNHQAGTLKAFKRLNYNTTAIGNKVIWIDDHADRVAESPALAILEDPMFMTVVPDSRIGLTHAHIDNIANFLDS